MLISIATNETANNDGKKKKQTPGSLTKFW